MADNKNTTDDAANHQATLNSFSVAFGVNIIVAAVVFLVFCFMRTRHSRIYAPRCKLVKGCRIPELPKGLFNWIIPLFRLTDDQILEASGLDALILVRILRFGYHLFFSFCIWAFGVILPLNYTGANGLHGFHQISMSNIGQKSQRLWAHVISVYIFTGITLFLLNKHFKEFVQLRIHFNQIKRPNSYTVMVHDIPNDDAHDDDLKRLFDFMYNNTVHTAVAEKDVAQLDQFYEKREAYCQTLEHYMYLHEHDPDLTRPRNKLGFLGLFGEEVDSIEYYQRKLDKYNRLVDEGRTRPHRCSGNGFVTFTNISSAALSVQVLHSSNTEAYHVVVAPDPDDVYWPNMSKDSRQKLIRSTLVGCTTFALVAFYMIPVTFVQGITSMESLSQKVPGFAKIVNANKTVKGFLQGFLPTLAMKIFLAILPIVCWTLSMLEGIEAYSWIEMAQLVKLFYFQVINVFLGSLISGSFVASLSSIINDPTSIASRLGTALPTKSTFFINYVMLLSTGFSLGLLRAGPLIISFLKIKFVAVTPKAKALAWAPPNTSYGTIYPEILLVFCIGITYSTIAPFVLIFCFLYMLYGCFAYKYEVTYVNMGEFESGGKFFLPVFNRIAIALIIFQLTLIGLIGLKGSPLSVVCIPAPVITAIAVWLMYQWYDSASRYTPILDATGLDKTDQDITGDGVKDLIDPLAYSKPCLKEGHLVPRHWDLDNRLVESGWITTSNPRKNSEEVETESSTAIVFGQGSSMHKSQKGKLATS